MLDILKDTAITGFKSCWGSVEQNGRELASFVDNFLLVILATADRRHHRHRRQEPLPVLLLLRPGYFYKCFLQPFTGDFWQCKEFGVGCWQSTVSVQEGWVGVESVCIGCVMGIFSRHIPSKIMLQVQIHKFVLVMFVWIAEAETALGAGFVLGGGMGSLTRLLMRKEVAF